MNTRKHQRHFATLILGLLIPLMSWGQKADCLNGLFICSNETLSLAMMPPLDHNMGTSYPCLPTDQWPNAITLFWTMANSGEIEFTLIPNDPLDDLDFILYEINPSDFLCPSWTVERCMASGPNLVEAGLWEPCSGTTGLSKHAHENMINPGCRIDEENFLSSLTAEVGGVYALTIMNFTSFSGFTIQFNSNMIFSTTLGLPIEVEEVSASNTNIQYTGCIGVIGDEVTESEDILSDTYQIHVYPNPTSNNLLVSVTGIQIKDYQIIDARGEEIFSAKSDMNNSNHLLEIVVNTLHSGVYLIKLQTYDGQVINRQFVKI